MSPDNQCLKFDIDESPTQNWHDNYQEDKDREREAALEWEKEREGTEGNWGHLVDSQFRAAALGSFADHSVSCANKATCMPCPCPAPATLPLGYSCQCVTFGLSWAVIVILLWHVAKCELNPFSLIAATHLAVSPRSVPLPWHIIFLPKLLRSNIILFHIYFYNFLRSHL